jgi:hypothetical protein
MILSTALKSDPPADEGRKKAQKSGNSAVAYARFTTQKRQELFAAVGACSTAIAAIPN